MNINGIVNKVDNIRKYIIREKIDIFILVETWLQQGDNLAIRPVVVDVREKKRNSQTCRGTGGIVIITSNLYRNKIKVKKVAEDNSWIQIEVANVDVIGVYLNPSVSQDNIDKYWEEMEKVAEVVEDMVILGDFNSRMGNTTGDHSRNTRGKKLEEFIRQSSFEIRNPDKGKWTTYCSKGRGINDLVFTKRNREHIIISLIVEEGECMGGSDHRPLIMTIGSESDVDNNMSQRWNLMKLRKDNIRTNYQQSLLVEAWKVNRVLDMVWKDVNRKIRSKQLMEFKEREAIIDNVWTCFKEWIETALYRSCGKCNGDLTTNKDFLTEKMKELELEVDNARKRAQEAIDNGANTRELKNLWRIYGKLKVKWKKRTKKRKEVVFKKTIDLLNFPGEKSTFMKIITAIKKKEGKAISGLNMNDVEGHRAHFQTTFGGEPTGHDILIDGEVLLNTDDSKPIQIHRIRVISQERIKRIITETPVGKAAGSDGLPGEVWKWAGEVIVNPLAELFTLCETLVIIPTEWKQAVVAPIYKNKGDKTNISNYRPIALTCVVRRMYEKNVNKHFGHLLEAHMVNNQGGFRTNMSTYDQILRLQEAIVNNKECVLTFLDIRAAYDCVDRRILWTDLFKKFQVNERTIQLLRSLFDNNISTVLINGDHSSKIDNLRGLLQGSSLSPCLFNVFINSLAKKLNGKGGGLNSKGETFNNLLYADDTVLATKNTRQAQTLLNISEQWATTHGIEFAPLKCAVVLKNIQDEKLTLYKTRVPTVKNYKYLGLYVDKGGINWELSMKARIEGAINRIHWMGRKGMNSFGWRPMMNLNAYKSYIRPMIEYGLGLQIIPSRVIGQLQLVQNMALRRMSSINKTTSIAALHIIYGLEYMEERNQILNMKYFNKLIKGNKKAQAVGKVVINEMAVPQSKLKGGSLVNKFRKQNKWRNKIIAGNGKILQKDITRSKEDNLLSHKNNGGKISQRLDIRNIGQPTDIFKHAGELTRLEGYLIQQWLLGKSTSYTISCKICGMKLHDEHLLNCGGGKEKIELIRRKYHITLGASNITLKNKLDETITRIGREKTFQVGIYKEIANLLIECKRKTMGWEKREVDIYSDDEDENENINKRLKQRKEEYRRKKKNRNHQ